MQIEHSSPGSLTTPAMTEPTAAYAGAADTIAYFSMEIGIEETIPTYSGGLGMLAGDTVRSAADMDVPLVAVSLVHRKGYFRQRLAADGTQTEEPREWSPATRLTEMTARTAVQIEAAAFISAPGGTR